jgi:hypothetical protein
LIEIIIPPSVEFLSDSCFAGCKSLSSVTFESQSRMPGIEKRVLTQRGPGGMIRLTSVEETSDIKD